jgi:putative aminopeptidase FrvX
MCAIRVPGEGYSAQAKALRFADGRVAVSAVGTVRFAKVGGQDQITFLSDGGQLTWYDSITMETEPLLRGGLISGTGLDNCIGCVTALGAAWALSKVDAFLRAAGRRVLFVFSDLEEGIPDAYFGHGAARLAGAMPPPTFGAIVVDGQNVGAPGNPAVWNGGSFGTVSGWSRGSFVAPNYCALGADLVQAVNLRWPNTAQVNTGYLSRSDDVPLGRWTQLLGMFGPPLVNAHTTEENAALSDLQGCMRLLALYLGVVSATPPELDRQYALTR